jgi:hypothetical protein
MRILLGIFLLSANFCLAQSSTCVVNVKELQGSYEGECKSQKAHGKGKAIGEDTYEGDFKNGFPEGTGKYTWKNGSWYEGAFKNGLKEGEGVLHLFTANQKDSTVTGFWRKGAYIGLYEAAYKVQSKSYMISTVKVEEMKSTTTPYEIEIYLTSVSGGAASIGNGGEIPKPVISDVQVNKGSYLKVDAVTNTPKSNYYYFKDVIFPFSANFKIGQEEVVIDFFKTANYKVEIRSKQ